MLTVDSGTLVLALQMIFFTTILIVLFVKLFTWVKKLWRPRIMTALSPVSPTVANFGEQTRWSPTMRLFRQPQP
jgi:hypothetical protein